MCNNFIMPTFYITCFARMSKMIQAAKKYVKNSYSNRSQNSNTVLQEMRPHLEKEDLKS